MERRYRLPAEFRFDFVATVMLRVPEPADAGLRLLARAAQLAEKLFAALGVGDGELRSHESEEAEEPQGAGMFVFPVTVYRVVATRGEARYQLSLERMHNGHLGCNEDCLDGSLSLGDRRLTLHAYRYVDDFFTLSFEGIAPEELAPIFVDGLELAAAEPG